MRLKFILPFITALPTTSSFMVVSTRSGKRAMASAMAMEEGLTRKRIAKTSGGNAAAAAAASKKGTKAKSTPPKAAAKSIRTKNVVETVVTTTKVATKASDPLLTLSPDCIAATLVCRPSKRNRSPYVADILLPDNREAICHMPNLDMGGKCAPGVTVLVEPFKDKKSGLPIGSEAVSPKYGTPKCEFAARLVRVDENQLDSRYPSVWVGGHPTLGEMLAEELIRRHVEGISVVPGWGKVESFRKQVTIGPSTRADFVLTMVGQERKHIVEVKTVVDTDYCKDWNLPEKVKCLFTSDKKPYRRAGIFPWGQSNQKGPDGEKVVSARAIKHVRELTGLVQKSEYDATILFIVIREDAEIFRPNQEACPSFSRYLREADEGGVQVLANRIRWGEGDQEIGKCYADKWLEIEYPTLT